MFTLIAARCIYVYHPPPTGTCPLASYAAGDRDVEEAGVEGEEEEDNVCSRAVSHHVVNLECHKLRMNMRVNFQTVKPSHKM